MLALACPHCAAEILPSDKFCGECGHDLGEPVEAPPIDYNRPQSYTPRFLADKILSTRSSIEGERKLVTVLFADVADYTSMAEKLDPEEVHQIMDGCFKILMDEIHRYEGTINQFTGDGVMALFGAPVAHEDHAQRACYAALSVQKAMGEYGEKIKKDRGVAFKMRTGLNSGPVIVGSIGDDLRMDYTAIGDTTNLAARIQQKAKPGEVWMSQETCNIIKDYFQDEPVGELALKGKAEPQRIYRVVSEQPGVRTRFEAGLVRGVTEFVGRRPEMEALRSEFERVKAGGAQIVDVVGEAGVGKSRLVYEFRKLIGEEVTFLNGICIQYGGNISFLPVMDIVKAAFGIQEGMSEEETGNRIEERATGSLVPMIPFYRKLLSLKVDDPGFNALDPEGRKYGTFEAVKTLLLVLSTGRPLVVFLEDAHWIDKISEEFFTYFSRCILGHPILMLTAYRPECSPPWAQGAHYQRLGLETLSSKSSVRLVRNVLGGYPLDPDLEQKIVEMTGGNAFFVEEIVRELRQRGDILQVGDRYVCNQPIDQLEIPSTVQGVLAARMDRLSDDLKRTMQVASVIGRDFAFSILKSIMELGDELRARLTNLVGLEILYEKALYPELEYIFKHTLTQEVAYESLLKQRRQEIHARIGGTIEKLYAHRLAEYYELLAHHYERSGNAAKAVKYLLLAGEKSIRQGAAQAAFDFFNKAVESIEAAHLVLEPEAEVRLHKGRASASWEIGAIGNAAEGFRKAIEISRRHGMIDYEKDSLSQLTLVTYMWPVREEAERTFEEGLARAREIEDEGLESIVLSTKGLFAALNEQPYQGNQMVLDAERLALESGSPTSILTNRLVRAFTERWLGRPAKTIELTEGIVEAMRSAFLMPGVANAILARGIALAEIGRIQDAMTLIKEGIDICEKFGAFHRYGTFYNCLGYCYGEIYQPEQAYELNLQSDKIARRQMEQYPVGIRQYGEIVAQANVNIAENLFDQGKWDEAWDWIQSFKEEGKSDAFDGFRRQWETRMSYLAAQILLNRSDLDQAAFLIHENLERVQKLHSKKREGGLWRLLGEIHTRRKQPENAIENLGKAIDVLKGVENPRQLWQAHASLGSALGAVGRNSEAKEQWGNAAEIIRNIAKALTDPQLREGFLKAGPIRDILSKADD
jgi:class 3 adenylate cyclase/tetratricopeptide (TPR) repeat protein